MTPDVFDEGRNITEVRKKSGVVRAKPAKPQDANLRTGLKEGFKVDSATVYQPDEVLKERN
jgi:hypothetical protein